MKGGNHQRLEWKLGLNIWLELKPAWEFQEEKVLEMVASISLQEGKPPVIYGMMLLG